MKVHGIHFKREKKLCSRKHVLLLWAWAIWLISPDTALPVFILGDISYAISQCLFSVFNHRVYSTAGSAHHSSNSTIHLGVPPVHTQNWNKSGQHSASPRAPCKVTALEVAAGGLLIWGVKRSFPLWRCHQPTSGNALRISSCRRFTRLEDIFHLHTFQFNSLLSWNFLL